MTPIAQNMIRVVDEIGNTLSPTYIRRAKGLVKAGRAYWTSPDMSEICLYDPPDDINIKPEDIMNDTETRTNELTEDDYNSLHSGEVTLETILDRMDAIRADCQHIYTALELLKNFNVNESPNGGLGDAERAKTILAIVQCRETTLQRELALYEKIYNDLVRVRYVSSEPEQN